MKKRKQTKIVIANIVKQTYKKYLIVETTKNTHTKLYALKNHQKMPATTTILEWRS